MTNSILSCRMTWHFFEISLKCGLYKLLRCWSTITPRNLALFTRCTTTFRKITSFWVVRFFLRDNNVMIICVLFTLIVSLLESNHNATLANSVLRISIALSIKSFWTYVQNDIEHNMFNITSAILVIGAVTELCAISASEHLWCIIKTILTIYMIDRISSEKLNQHFLQYF